MVLLEKSLFLADARLRLHGGQRYNTGATTLSGYGRYGNARSAPLMIGDTTHDLLMAQNAGAKGFRDHPRGTPGFGALGLCAGKWLTQLIPELIGLIPCHG